MYVRVKFMFNRWISFIFRWKLLCLMMIMVVTWPVCRIWSRSTSLWKLTLPLMRFVLFSEFDCCNSPFCRQESCTCKVTLHYAILPFFQDRITDLQAQTQHFAEVGHFDADSLQDKSRQIADRYDKWVNPLLLISWPQCSDSTVLHIMLTRSCSTWSVCLNSRYITGI